MANTYTKILLYLVFAVKNRDAIIPIDWQPRIHSYISRTLNLREHHALNVGGTENHVHILFDYNVNEKLPDLVRDLKTLTNTFANKNRMTPFIFGWQKGYACFSVSPSNSQKVGNYIKNQQMHHNGRSLQEEVVNMLNVSGIQYDRQYIFDDID